MLYVSIFVELLRARPALAVWLAALAQAALWVLVPTLFYASPPGELAAILAVGHEFPLGIDPAPPLAYWLAEIAYRMPGSHLFGVYVLSQLCVVATYWVVFVLGRSIVGPQHACLAVLLMVGISAFTVPTPEFGPVILTMPLWAMILLHYWRVVGEGKKAYWLALAIEISLLLLTSYAGFLLAGLLTLFTLVNRRARATLGSTDPWLAGIVAVVVMVPHLLWYMEAGDELAQTLNRLRMPESGAGNFNAWFHQMALIVSSHVGLVALVAMVIGWPWALREPAPTIVRWPIDAFARQFVYFFAIMPILAATSVAVLMGSSAPLGGVAPLVILSGLGIVIAGGDGIELGYQRVVVSTWFGLLLVPPIMTVMALFVLPWLGIVLNVNQPARTMALFFDESFQRRVGAPLPIVAGEPHVAGLIALAAPSRPSLFLDATPELSPWVTMSDVKKKGAILVWPATDNAGTPPAALRARFPDMVPEPTPRAFERPMAGRLPLFRIGWAVIRPQADAGGGTAENR